MDIKFKKYILIGLGGLYISLFWLWSELPDGKVHVDFLDIGQGDAVLIRSEFGHTVLIDGGPGNRILSKLNGKMPFFMKEIDLMVLTHPHSDHLDGLIEVFKRYDVKNILITGVEYSNSYYREFLKEMALNKNVNIYFASASLDFRIGGLNFDTIYPLREMVGEKLKNVNNSSIGFVVSFVGGDGVRRKILLNGDNEREVEAEIVASREVDLGPVDIFKASHHGSKTANTIEFLKAFKPKVVVISCGSGNKFEHPHAESMYGFQQIGSTVFRTDEDGDVEFEW